MIDKQIIIDGVDVSGCIHYQDNMCTATKDNYGDCSFYCKDYDMNDCYFKQLKRKEQECEKYKQALAKIEEIAESEIDSKEFMVVQCMLNGNVDNKNKILKQILQKISEVEDAKSV